MHSEWVFSIWLVHRAAVGRHSGRFCRRWPQYEHFFLCGRSVRMDSIKLPPSKPQGRTVPLIFNSATQLQILFVPKISNDTHSHTDTFVALAMLFKHQTYNMCHYSTSPRLSNLLLCWYTPNMWALDSTTHQKVEQLLTQGFSWPHALKASGRSTACIKAVASTCMYISCNLLRAPTSTL